jgi:hypothetical protein
MRFASAGPGVSLSFGNAPGALAAKHTYTSVGSHGVAASPGPPGGTVRGAGIRPKSSQAAPVQAR